MELSEVTLGTTVLRNTRGLQDTAERSGPHSKSLSKDLNSSGWEIPAGNA